MLGNMFNFNGLFGHIGPGLCRLAMNGRIAVKTSQGYKTYDPKNETLVNCSNFCFDAGDELFFSIPTNKVVPREHHHRQQAPAPRHRCLEGRQADRGPDL